MDRTVKKMLDELDSKKDHYQKLLDYYNGKHRFINNFNFGDSNQPQNRISIPYPRKIIDFLHGYFLGKQTIYSSKVEEDPFLNELDNCFLEWEELHNSNLYKKASIFGKAFELVYVNNEGEFRCTSFSPLEMVVMTDGTIEENVVKAVRKYKLQYDDTEYVDIYDEEYIVSYKLDNGKLEEINRKINIFGVCPIRILKNNDSEQGAFEQVIPLIDKYDLIHSLNLNEIEYFRNAYMLLEGMDGTEDEEIRKMKTNRVLKIPQGTKADFLVKKIDGQFLKDELERTEKEIIQQSNIAMLSTTPLQSNVSGSALKTKLTETENVVSYTEAILENVIYWRLKLLCKFYKIKQGRDYTYKNIIMTFTRNVPSNLKELADIIGILSGHVSNQTLIEQLPFVVNPVMEMQRLTKERGTEQSPDDVKNMISNVLSDKDGQQEN